MPTLYRNYTVVVQDSDNYLPKNDLELLLYEGRIEIKPDPTAGGDNAVFQYGTVTKATRVVDEDGAQVSATIADATLRPGEYDFERLNLDGTTSGNLGTTLYSVVARPSSDSSLGSFQRAAVIVDRTDISDPNLKQLVKASLGSTESISDNLAFAGGTVLSEEFGGSSDESTMYLKLTSLPDTISELVEEVSVVPAYADSGQNLKLVARFNVFYSSADGSEYIVWNKVPAYKTSDNSWVIKLTDDAYNISRSNDFGSDGGEIALNGVWTEFKIAVNYDTDNIHVRSFDNVPGTTIPAANSIKEKTVIHGFVDGSGNRIAGIGNWTYSSAANTPSYNLDVKGSVGARIQVGSNTTVLSSASQAAIGPDILNSGTKHAIDMNLGISTTVSLAGKTRINLTNANVYIGVDTSTYPYIKTTSATIQLLTSAYTFLTINTGDEISMYSKTGSASTLQRFKVNSTDQRIGYDIDTTYFGSNSLSTFVVVDSKLKLYALTSGTYLAFDSSTYPRILATSSYIRTHTSANTYWEATNADNQLSAYTDSKLAIDMKSSYVKVGYDISTSGNYVESTTSYISAYLSGHLRFRVSSLFTVIYKDINNFFGVYANELRGYINGFQTLSLTNTSSNISVSSDTYFNMVDRQIDLYTKNPAGATIGRVVCKDTHIYAYVNDNINERIDLTGDRVALIHNDYVVFAHDFATSNVGFTSANRTCVFGTFNSNSDSYWKIPVVSSPPTTAAPIGAMVWCPSNGYLYINQDGSTLWNAMT